MAFDGAGTFLRLYSWVVDATSGVKVRADRHDAEDNNFANGLSNCITKDGQTAVTQNIPLNSRRLISVADPVDPQDASTKAYADTKASLAGGASFTGDVIVKKDGPTFILNGKPGFTNGIYGQKNDKNRWSILLGNAVAETGGDNGSDFQLLKYADDGTTASGVLYGYRATGLMVVAGNPTAAMGIATKNYADTVSTAAAAGAAASKLPLAGGTITGELTLAINYLRFGVSGGPGYLQWMGGGNYDLGGGGRIWHSGNFNPAAATGTVSDAKLVLAGVNFVNDFGITEPFQGAVMTGFGYVQLATQAQFRYLQIKTTSWYTVSYTTS